MSKQQQSSAARYRKIRESRRAESLKAVETFQVTTASGMVWTVRRPSFETYLISGILPNSLINKVAHSLDGEVSGDSVLHQLTTQESMQSLIFAREMVRDICVSPRITDAPRNEDDIHPSEIELDDFKELFQWGMQNAVGGEARRLNSFRGESGAASDARTRRP